VGEAKTSKRGGLMGLGSPVLPHLPKHAGDRNRTSPFAFTGNKFEFRALGGSQTISFAATVLNTIVAESIDELTSELESMVSKTNDLESALEEVISRDIKKIKRIIFNGDNYSQEWHKEAEQRGLLNFRNTLEAIPHLCDEKNLALFERYGVLSHRELEARQEIAYDQYFKTINIEGETTAELARTMVLPAAVRYLNEVLAAAERTKTLGLEPAGKTKLIGEMNGLVNELVEALHKLEVQNAELGGDTVHSKAHHMRDNVIPAMNAVRATVDRLEKVLPDDLWPMPRYREMLFIR
jgi:glutamine synthetase